MNPYESTRQEVSTQPRTTLGILHQVLIWCLPIILPVVAALLTRAGLFASLLGPSIFSRQFLIVVTFVVPIVAILTNAVSRMIAKDSMISAESIAHLVFCAACGFFFRWLVLEMASSV